MSLKYSYDLTNLFGLSDKNFFSYLHPETIPTGSTKGSSYLEANINHEVMDKLTLGFHVGHQKVKNASDYSYSDYKVSLNKELPKEYFGLNVGVAYSDTNAKEEAWTGVAPYAGSTDAKYLGDKTWFLSVAKTF